MVTVTQRVVAILERALTKGRTRKGHPPLDERTVREYMKTNQETIAEIALHVTRGSNPTPSDPQLRYVVYKVLRPLHPEPREDGVETKETPQRPALTLTEIPPSLVPKERYTNNASFQSLKAAMGTHGLVLLDSANPSRGGDCLFSAVTLAWHSRCLRRHCRVHLHAWELRKALEHMLCYPTREVRTCLKRYNMLEGRTRIDELRDVAAGDLVDASMLALLSMYLGCEILCVLSNKKGCWLHDLTKHTRVDVSQKEGKCLQRMLTTTGLVIYFSANMRHFLAVVAGGSLERLIEDVEHAVVETRTDPEGTIAQYEHVELDTCSSMV